MLKKICRVLDHVMEILTVNWTWNFPGLFVEGLELLVWHLLYDFGMCLDHLPLNLGQRNANKVLLLNLTFCTMMHYLSLPVTCTRVWKIRVWGVWGGGSSFSR